ncbi:MAG TPA: tripartite tricarboxylate transporter substrate binding protein [Casimicrobiaceae bacterium]|nr:tripartite tricarboxylate transporter substrate binding protein [Casimicrobiaceae bacterium]
MMSIRPFTAGIGWLAAALLPAIPLPALSQAYPDKPVRFIVPFTPGTGPDILARTLSEPMSKRLGVPIIVENKAGASGNIGTDQVAKAAPDGYTLLFTVNTFSMAPALYKPLSFDPVNDFAPVGEIAVGNLALVVNPALGVNSVADLVALAKSKPGALNYASPGNGTPHHLAMELFKQQMGVDIVHVPYKGTAGAVTDVLANQVPMMILPVHVALPYAKSGKLRILAVSGDKRSPLAPDLPTFKEAGMPGFDVDLWYGLLAPAHTPPAVIERLNQEIAAALAQSEVRDTLLKQGLIPVTSTPEALGTLIRNDLARWESVVVQGKIKAD